MVERLQDILGDGFRQVDEQVGEIVEFHAVHRGDELLGFHFLDEPVADFVSEFNQDIAFIVRVDHLPENSASLQVDGFEQSRYFRRVQAVDHEASRPQAATVEPLAQQLQVGLGVLSRVHGGEFTCGL